VVRSEGRWCKVEEGRGKKKREGFKLKDPYFDM